MGCGTSQHEWEQFHHEPRQSAQSPDNISYKNFVQEKQKLRRQKLLDDRERSKRRSSNLEWVTKTNLDIANMARKNTWLRSLLYAPSNQKTGPAPTLPEIESWPQEAKPMNKVMIGKHRSDICFAGSMPSKPVLETAKAGARGSGDGGNKIESPTPKQRVRRMDPLDSKSSKSALSPTLPATLPPITKTAGVNAGLYHNAERVLTAHAKCQTAEHFGAVLRAKAVFTQSFSPRGEFPVVSVCEIFPDVQLLARSNGKITEQPASYDRFIPQAGQNQLGIDLDTIQKVSSTKGFPWLAVNICKAVSSTTADKQATADERPETSSPVGANCYTPVCEVEGTSDPHLSCVHNLRRYGRVAFQSTQSIDMKEDCSALCELDPVGASSAVASSYVVSASASRKRNLLGLNIKESPASLYHIAPIKKYPNPRRALKELQHPQPGLAVSNYVQTNDFLEKATERVARTHYVRPTKRAHSACLEAVTKVDYDEVHRLTGEDETLDQDDAIIKQGVEEAKTEPKNSFVTHQAGFVPYVFKEEPVVVKNRIIRNVEDLAPSVLRGPPNPERPFSNMTRTSGPEMPEKRLSSQARPLSTPWSPNTPRPYSQARPYSRQYSQTRALSQALTEESSEPHSREPSRPPTNSSVT